MDPFNARMSSTRVTVVGAGVVGLTTALSLLERGFRNVEIVADKFSPDTTSDGAGAVWRPFALPETEDSGQAARRCRASINWLKHMKEIYGDASGIHSVSGYELIMSSNPTYPYWASHVDGFRMLTEDEIRTKGHGAKSGFAYTTIIYVPGIFMRLLTDLIERKGGKFRKETVRNLDEIDADIVVNCTGLGSSKVTNDRTVFPIRGQTIVMKSNKVKEFKMVQDGPYSLFYMLPRPNGEIVVGGTKQEHDWNVNTDENDVRAIRARAKVIAPELEDAVELRTWAGLRPARKEGIRVELEGELSAKGAFVIHNYGHGGSGHTLHRGCAEEVADYAVYSVTRRSKL